MTEGQRLFITLLMAFGGILLWEGLDARHGTERRVLLVLSGMALILIGKEAMVQWP